MAFEQLQATYGESFAPLARRKGEAEAKYQERAQQNLRLWAAALADLTEAEIKAGVVRCIRTMPYGLRITPADVISRAELDPLDYGLFTLEDAFSQAMRTMALPEDRRHWLCPVVATAADRVGMNNWRRSQRVFEIFKQHYAAIVRMAANGVAVEMPKQRALPHLANRPAPTTTAGQLFEQHHAQRTASTEKK